MRGHIRERSTWSLRHCFRNPRSRYRQTSAQVAQLRRDEAPAQIECAHLISELSGGTYLEPTKTTLAQFLEQWLANIKGNVSPRTHERLPERSRRKIWSLFWARSR